MIADLADVVERHDRILYEIQQQMSSSVNVPSGGGGGVTDPNPTFETITLSDGTTTMVLDFSAATPTGVALATGSVFNNNYVDVSWDAATDDRVHEYSVDYARKVAGVYQLEDSSGKIGGNSLRIEGLMPNTTYGFRVWGYNGLGLPSATPAWNDIATGQDNTVPAALTGLTLTAGFRSVLFKWNPSGDTDVVRGGLYKMEIATNAGFTAGLLTKLTTSYVDSFDDLATGTQYWGRIYPIDASGNQGPPVSAGPVTTAQVVTGDLANLLVDATKLADSAVTPTKIANLAVGTAAIALLAVGTGQMADLAVTGAKIASATIDDGHIIKLDAGKVNFGSMSGDRISANTLDVIALKSSSITTATLTLNGGTLRALNGTGGVGMAINSQGISIYNSAGTRTIFLDATSGAGTFAGTLSGATGTFAGTLTAASGSITGWLTMSSSGGIRTAASGKRIELTSTTTDVARIRLYSGNPTETVAPWISNDGAGTLELNGGVYNGISNTWIQIQQGGGQISMQSNAQTTIATLSGNIVLRSAGGVVAGPNGTTLLGSSAWNTYACFMYNGVATSNYALLQDSAANTYLNCGAAIYIRYQNADRMQVTADGVCMKSTLYLKNNGDNAHRLVWTAASDGTTLESYQGVAIRSQGWDQQELIAFAGQSNNRSVNGNNGAWRDHLALTHWNESDIKAKQIMKAAHPRGTHKDIARSVGRPFAFKWKKGQAAGMSAEGQRWGLDATVLPAEFTGKAIGTGATPDEVTMMVDPQSMIAALYGAVNDLIDDISDLTTQYQALAARVDKIAA